jgi:hypothetical protein
MSKTLILYGSKHKLTAAHKRISNSKQPAYFVRAETVNASFARALRQAKPLNQENLLGAVPIGDEEK